MATYLSPAAPSRNDVARLNVEAVLDVTRTSAIIPWLSWKHSSKAITELGLMLLFRYKYLIIDLRQGFCYEHRESLGGLRCVRWTSDAVIIRRLAFVDPNRACDLTPPHPHPLLYSLKENPGCPLTRICRV
jgi:predicted phosphatase